MVKEPEAKTPEKKPIEPIGYPEIGEAENGTEEMEKITILEARIEPMSTIGTLIYKTEGGSPGTVFMDHRCFWNFIEGIGDPVGKSFEYDGATLIPMEG